MQQAIFACAHRLERHVHPAQRSLHGLLPRSELWLAPCLCAMAAALPGWPGFSCTGIERRFLDSPFQVIVCLICDVTNMFSCDVTPRLARVTGVPVTGGRLMMAFTSAGTGRAMTARLRTLNALSNSVCTLHFTSVVHTSWL